MIQIADITGVFGVSFWIISINILIFSIIKEGIISNFLFISIITLISCLILGYGLIKFNTKPDESVTPITISTIYTSILSKDKEKTDFKKRIFEILKQLTLDSKGASNHLPAIIIWPETSVPVFIRSFKEKEFIKGLLNLSSDIQAPLLIGALSFQKDNDKSIRVYNSAFLIPKNGFINQEYRKRILAPFTETNPFNKVVPKKFQTLFKSKFEAGDKKGIMSISNKITFSVAICYEIFFPNFVRQSTSKKKSFLVNITNDHRAFNNLKSAYKIPIPHLIFRAIENGKYLIRSANWGYTMVVSPTGKIIKSTHIGSSGFLNNKIEVNTTQTFFSRYGFLFAKTILLVTMIWAFLLFKKVYQNNKNMNNN